VQVPAAKTVVDLAIGDADDDHIGACALAAPAQVFVTGDKALLGLRSVHGLPIVSPREFWLQSRPA
jgi:predicted nucleic acid-binding protein